MAAWPAWNQTWGAGAATQVLGGFRPCCHHLLQDRTGCVLGPGPPLQQQFSTGMLQEFLKHAIPNYLVRGTDLFSLRSGVPSLGAADLYGPGLLGTRLHSRR